MVYIGIMIAIIILDQGTKYLALKYLSQKENRPVIKDFLYFTIVKNKGAALGILKSKPLLLKMITVSTIGALFWYLIKLLKVIGMSGAKLMLSFIIGGAVGNLIDRFTRKYVVDFFYFKPKKSPVFNLADFFVIIGTIGLQLLLIFKKEINRI